MATEEKEYVLKRISKNHIQIIGRFLVNYYPSTGRIYVNGTTGEPKIYGNIDRAIKAARQPPKIVRPEYREKRKSPEYYRKIRHQLANTPCKWCGKILSFNDSTIEHIIPLARGGTNGRDNLAIACSECNEKHADGVFLERKDAWFAKNKD